MSVISVLRLDALIRAAGVPIDGVAEVQPGVARVDYQASATAEQRATADAIVASFDWSESADAIWTAQQERANASAGLDSPGGDPNRLLTVALMEMILDEFNRHTTFESSMLAAIAAASSLADLKTRMAAISPGPQQRTRAQLVDAIKAKVS